jgi:hypothetical protein
MSISFYSQKKFQVKGVLIESDSNTAVPFAYAINMNSRNGVVTDMRGNFVIAAGENDSIQFTCIGYTNVVYKVKNIPNANDSVKQFTKFYITKMIYDLAPLYVNRFKIKPNERAYMQRVINRPKVTGLNVAESPITALWQAFSKKGREMQKLELIFKNLLRQEEIEKRLNTEILRKLLNDENITLQKFRIICPEITDDFILYSEAYELYSQVSASYQNYLQNSYHFSR